MGDNSRTLRGKTLKNSTKVSEIFQQHTDKDCDLVLFFLILVTRGAISEMNRSKANFWLLIDHDGGYNFGFTPKKQPTLHCGFISETLKD